MSQDGFANSQHGYSDMSPNENILYLQSGLLHAYLHTKAIPNIREDREEESQLDAFHQWKILQTQPHDQFRFHHLPDTLRHLVVSSIQQQITNA